MITVVTAYYKISSKHSNEMYTRWIENFFKVPCNLYIFTDKKSLELLKQIKVSSNIYYHELEMSDFFTNKYNKLWQHSYNIDYERMNSLNHTIELYKIWSEKIFFVKKAIENNIFNSNIFCWSDIGVIREQDMFPKVLNFPNSLSNQLDPNKIMFSMINQFTTDDVKILDNGIAKCYNNISDRSSCYQIDRIQGGFFAGYKEPLLKYAEMYDKELELFEKTQTFAGKDQYVMGNILIKNNEFFQVNFDQNKFYHNEWFSFLIKFS